MKKILKIILIDVISIAIVIAIALISYSYFFQFALSTNLPDNLSLMSDKELNYWGSEMPLLFIKLILFFVLSVVLIISLFSYSRYLIWAKVFEKKQKLKLALKSILLGFLYYVPAFGIIILLNMTLVQPYNSIIALFFLVLSFSFSSVIFANFVKTEKLLAVFKARYNVRFLEVMLITLIAYSIIFISLPGYQYVIGIIVYLALITRMAFIREKISIKLLNTKHSKD